MEECLQPFKDRKKPDLIIQLVERILDEPAEKLFKKIKAKILETVKFHKGVETWFEHFFFANEAGWRMIKKDKHLFTGGLHTRK